MAKSARKTIYLPAELVREAQALARTEGKTLSGVIQDALRSKRVQRHLLNLRGIQGYWTRVALNRGILTERDLARYLTD